MDLQTLKAALPFPDLVRITHTLPKTHKLLCPYHHESTPSYHVYQDHGFCFACHTFDDHISWLEHQRGFSTYEAIRYLRQLVGGIPLLNTTPSLAKEQQHNPKPCEAKPISQEQWQSHQKKALKLNRLPKSLENRGFSLADLKQLQIAAHKEDAILPIFDPQGKVVALKTRHFIPNPYRYSYLSPNHGTPAWCSPNLNRKKSILVIEGELNAMISYCAFPELGIMGIAGSSARLHLNVLNNKTIYLYADGDLAGQKARHNWARDAYYANAKAIYLLHPWFIDACEVAALYGKTALKQRLQDAFSAAKPFDPSQAHHARASPSLYNHPASFDAVSLNQKIPSLRQTFTI